MERDDETNDTDDLDQAIDFEKAIGLEPAIDFDWSGVVDTAPRTPDRDADDAWTDAAWSDTFGSVDSPPPESPLPPAPSADDASSSTVASVRDDDTVSVAELRAELREARLDGEELRALVSALAEQLHELRDEITELRAETVIQRVSVGYLRRHGAANSDVATLRAEVREVQDRLGIEPTPPPSRQPLPDGVEADD